MEVDVGTSGRIVLLDQLASSASNFLFVFLIARYLGAADLASLSVLYTAFASAVAVARAGAGQVLLLFGIEGQPLRGLRAPVTLVGILASLIIVLIGASTSAWGPALVLAVSAPFLVYADVLRYFRIAQGLARDALTYDSAWLLISASGYGLCIATNNTNALELVVVFAVSGAIPFPLLALKRERATDSQDLGNESPWWRANRKSVAVFGYEAIWQGLWANASGVLLIATVGYEALAGFRRAQAPVLPIVAAFSAYSAYLAASGLMTERAADARSRLLLLLPALAPAVVAVVVVGASDDFLAPLLGRAVASEHLNTGILLIGASATGLALVDALRVRAARDLRFLGHFRTVAAPMETASVLLGGLAAGGSGAVMGYVAANVANAMVFRSRARLLRRRDRIETKKG